MSARPGYFKLGLFILGAITTLVAFVVALGAGALFQKRTYLETYFDGSVQGLDIGSAVKYRGVTVGQISEITFSYAHYEQDVPMAARKRYVMVLVRARPELIGLPRGFDPGSLQAEIDKGLRVRITPWGITGTNYLELDYVDPAHNPPLPIGWTPENVYIPSAPGAVAQITNAAEDLARRLQKLDVEGLVDSVTRLALGANAALEQMRVGELRETTAGLLAEVRETNRGVRALLTSPELKALPRDAAAVAARARQLVESEELHRSLAELRQTLQGFNRLAAGQEGDLAATLDNVRAMTENLRDLTEDLRAYPSQVLRGAPPPRSERR